MWEELTKIEICEMFWWIIGILCLGYPSPMEKVEILCLGYPSPMEKSRNFEKWQLICFDECCK